MHACKQKNSYTTPGFPAPNSHKTAREKEREIPHPHPYPHFPPFPPTHPPTLHPLPCPPRRRNDDGQANNALEPPALSLGDLAWGAGDLLRRAGWGGPPSAQDTRDDRPRPDERPPSLTPHTPPLSLSRIGALPTGPHRPASDNGGDEEREPGVHSAVSSPSRRPRQKIGEADERRPEQA